MTNKQIIKKYGGKTVAFKDLPLHHQFAYAWYMAIDGEAWELFDSAPDNKTNYYTHLKNLRKWMFRNMDLYISRYGKTRVGVLDVPMSDFTKLAYEYSEKWHDDIGFNEGGFKDFDAYHKWYMKQRKGEFKAHTDNDYPGILNGFEKDESGILEDGWHRFHTYYKKGLKKMPLIYFP